MRVVVALLLAAAAWFGHAFLLTVWLNVWYSIPFRRWVHKRMRALVALAVFAFPIVLARLYHDELLTAWNEPAALLRRPFVFGYLAVCWFTTLVYLPVVSVIRSRR